ncbi:MAG: hypothetical protein U0791_08190 [Gemmataceae bacterium]
MARRITDWLRSEPLPRNAYELLGHPLLDPDRDALLQTLRTANRELLDYQSHPEPAVAKRAMFLLTELGRYRGILEDAGKHQAYLDDVCRTLREQFVAERGLLALHTGNDLGTWLGLAYGVPSANADFVVKAVRGIVPPAQSLPKRGSKFGAFQAAAPEPEPIPAEVVEVIEPPPAVVKPAVYDLSEPLPPPLPPKPRKPAKLEPIDRVPRKLPKREKESSLAIPLAIGGGVLMLLAIVTAVVIAMTGEPEKEVRNDPPPERKPLPEPEPVPEPPPPKIEPIPEPKKVDPPSPTPMPSAAELEMIKREMEKKKEMERIAAEKKEMERIAAEMKEKERMEAERKEKERIAAEKKEKERIAAEMREKERIEDERRNPWAVVEGGRGTFPDKELLARVHSATIQKLTDSDKRDDDSGALLVVWVEVLNQGSAAKEYRRLIDYEKNSDYYKFCTLRDDSIVNFTTPNANYIKRAYWLSYDRKNIPELPDWYEDGSPSRTISPKGRVLIPIVFEKPKGTGKDFTLTINAVRIASKSGSGDEYGQYVLRIRDHHWKKAPSP